ncbi:MAG: hypothetical protein IT436_02280 [Phycisphaerales bacterium]|nr:hypothetical protein [Phycisphaerales bacterium]
MDPQILKQLAAGAIPPGLFAALVFLAVWWRPGPAVEAGRASRRTLWGALILAAAYITTHFIVLRGPVWPPASAADWLPYIAALAAGAGVMAGVGAGFRGARLMTRWVVTAVLIGGIGWMSAAGPIARSWNIRETLAHLGGFAAAALAASLAAARLTDRAAGPWPAVMIMLPVMTASQLLVVVYHSLLLGQAAGIAAAVVGGALAAAIVLRVLKRGFTLGPAGAVPSVLLAVTALFHGVVYTETEYGWLLGLLVAMSPVAAAVAMAFTARAASGWARLGAPLAAAVLPLAAAMAVAAGMGEAPTGY